MKDLRLPVAPPGRNCGAEWQLGSLGALRCVYARAHRGRCSWYDQAAAACDRSDADLVREYEKVVEAARRVLPDAIENAAAVCEEFCVHSWDGVDSHADRDAALNDLAAALSELPEGK